MFLRPEKGIAWKIYARGVVWTLIDDSNCGKNRIGHYTKTKMSHFYELRKRPFYFKLAVSRWKQDVLTCLSPWSEQACNRKLSILIETMTCPLFLASQAQWGNTSVPYPSNALATSRYCKSKKRILCFKCKYELRQPRTTGNILLYILGNLLSVRTDWPG